jgi:hypothetical protein
MPQDEPVRPFVFGAAAALLWGLLAIRWFDAGAPWRPAWLGAIPEIGLALPALLLGGLWLRDRWPLVRGAPLDEGARGLLLVLLLAFFFRLPIAWKGAAAAVTPDGALSGIVALHARDGIERLVFVPEVPYSGSLKSHLTAPLAAVVDPARAFALVSVLFYLAFVAALYHLARLADGPRTASLAGLYAAFAPAYVTRYSLSNDGNYVEVLALGTWALWLAARWVSEEKGRETLALAAGLLLGLAFWCHILAVIHLAAVGVALVVYGRFGALRSLGWLGFGWALGYAPGLLWNAGNRGDSFRYLLPGVATGEAGEGGSLVEKVLAMVTDHWPVLVGYDAGYPPATDAVVQGIAWAAVVLTLVATGRAAARALRTGSRPFALLLLFTAINLLVALLALPHVPGNPRYLQFLMAPLPIFLAAAFGRGRPRWLFAALVVFDAAASLAQVPGTLRADERWRDLARGLEQEGVRFCYTDFHLATKINFISGERVVCSAKLGPITTEYFLSYRERVERAPEVALVAVNTYAAQRMEQRLQALGVTYERRDFMKPVLLHLSRKVEPEELFPGRSFAAR